MWDSFWDYFWSLIVVFAFIAYLIILFNIIADRVETVTPWLVDHVLANDKHGGRIAWLTRGKTIRRFIASRFKPPGNRFPELDEVDEKVAA